MSADLVLDGLDKRFPGSPTPALRGFSLTVAAGTCTAVLGPSGSGKSTLLRVIAGLESPDAGAVRIGGTDVADVVAEHRGVGMVFQRSLLFPHLTILDNVAFSDRVSGMNRRAARSRASEYLEMVQLQGFGDRRVGELSGGQEQRVAIARALAAEPSVLLLDEPFSALDPALRSDMHDLLDSVRQAVSPTIVLVTHDRDEAARASDRIALLEHGVLLHEGTVLDAYRRPQNLRASQIMGGRNAVPGEVRNGRHHSALGAVPVPLDTPTGSGTLVIRQEDVAVLDGGVGPADTGSIAGVVESIRVTGARSEITVRCGEALLHAEAPPTQRCQLGDRIRVMLPTTAVHVVAD
ncbi:ABC transporter ATP-binding protein [Microbacterium sp. LWH13-1.2]|uniref:ABC transporter ATP-binding protein n=1 Tax=Microbacterium sp. LWH13-1.2 TaxID=3135260 RepID=UPI00313A3018